MSGIIVSVIVPFLESNNKLIDTLSSISEQKNINQENIEVLIVDATDTTSSKIASGSMSMCKVIHAKSVKSFADACNLAASKATGKYIMVCNCGDTFSDNYFESCIQVFNNKEKIPFVAGHRFCVNPVFREKKEFRLNKGQLESSVVNLFDNPNLINLELTGTFYRTEIFKSYKMNNKLKYESADDFALRIQLDYPEYVYLDEIEFDYFMPVSDDFMYYVPTNYKNWYTDSLNNFLKPLINDSKDRDGNIPLFIQFYIVFNITTKFLANMNNRNKRNMNDEELAVFF